MGVAFRHSRQVRGSSEHELLPLATSFHAQLERFTTSDIVTSTVPFADGDGDALELLELFMLMDVSSAETVAVLVRWLPGAFASERATGAWPMALAVCRHVASPPRLRLRASTSPVVCSVSLLLFDEVPRLTNMRA